MPTAPTDWQAFIHCFDDAAFLDGALASLPESVPVHVVDGRYATFPGERTVTPEAPAVCDSYPNVTYHRPPPERLPWGHAHDDDGTLRWPQYCEMQYSLSILDPETWTLKIDTDERLARFDVPLADLDPMEKVYASVLVDESPYDTMPDDRIWVPRLWVPQHWSFWTDDVLIPRSEVAVDAGAPALKAASDEALNKVRANLAHRDDLVIDNIGHTRPDTYLNRRERQLDRMYPYQRHL